MGEESKGPGRANDKGVSGNERPDIEERVLRYFRAHPTAMDSVEGIARFWVHEDRAAVVRAVAALQVRGLLLKRTIAGTDFYCLPQEPSEHQPGTPGEAARPTGSKGRILVVGDEAVVREFLVAALAGAGHSVAQAADGARAMEMLQAAPFDMVVTDVVMPGVSGIQVLEAARRLRPGTEVLVVTGHADLETALEVLRRGAYDMIPKPLSGPETLLLAVERALERRRLADDSRRLVDSLQARNQELKEAVARLAAINEIGAATTGLLDLNEIYGTLVRLVAQHLSARRVSVLIAEADSETMTLAASVGITEPEALGRTVRLGEGIAGRVAATEKPLLVQDIERTDFKWLRPGGRYKTSSFMITPLMISYPIRYKRRRLGVINVSDKHSGEPSTSRTWGSWRRWRRRWRRRSRTPGW